MEQHLQTDEVELLVFHTVNYISCSDLVLPFESPEALQSSITVCPSIAKIGASK